MSVRRVEVRLSRAAVRDVDHILAYTQRTCGVCQRAHYRAEIYRALERLSHFPEAGRPRDDRCPGCRSLQVEEHVIYFYQPGPDEIEVIRILHQRQDASAAVNEPPS